MSTLHEYVDNLFNSFSSNRRQVLEPKWRDAYNAFNRILDTSKNMKEGEADTWRSDAYLGALRQKVVAASAICADTMLQGGRVNFLLETSPESKEQLEIPGLPENFYEDRKEKMEARCEEQLSWAHADKKLRKGIWSGALYGDAYARLVVDDHTKAFYKPIGETISDSPDTLRFQFAKETKKYPKWEHLNIWNCFTDLEDPDVSSNLGFFYREYTRKAELKKLMRSDEAGVIKGSIKRVLDASDETTPDQSNATMNPRLEDLNTTFHNLRTLYFYGRVPTDKLKAFLEDNAPDMISEFDFEEDDEDYCETEVQMLLGGTANHILRVSPVDPVLGRAIFHVQFEDDSDDSTGGTGVADNCMNTQHLLNGIFRSIIDNQKLSGNALLGIKEEHLMEGFNEVVPGKKIRLSPECPDIRQAIQNFQIQDVSPGLLNTFGLVAQMLEEDSNIPKIQQGIDARGDETAFSVSQRLEKSGKYFGQVISNYDDGFVEKIITYLYHYNMMDSDFEEAKGDYIAHALGFSSFQDRVVRMNGLRQFFELVLQSPETFERLKLENLFREFARMLDLDPEQVTFSQEELDLKAQEEAEARQAEMEAQQLQQRQQDAAIARDQSQAVVNNASANRMNEELKMDQLKLINEATNPNQET